jgi:hypothetical protein
MTTTSPCLGANGPSAVGQSGDGDEPRDRWTRKLHEMGFGGRYIQAIMAESEGVETLGATMRARAAIARRLEETRDERRRIEELERRLEEAVRVLTFEDSTLA